MIIYETTSFPVDMVDTSDAHTKLWEHVQITMPRDDATIPRLAKWDLIEMQKRLGDIQLNDIEADKFDVKHLSTIVASSLKGMGNAIKAYVRAIVFSQS
ncbi:hypothetical protein RHSIM_RhsimUnG0226500 [Rhododendron simsii]|uniref:Uncharacterized protein n=1 Tax=Rhododendron simsii TaxID=118357 RepID=A0A834FTH3_RHOSS|nr:hypothetical protein RHSIM_RhsimUnG0226500 [Rhododendron simsii]